jgi:sugar O-acyltransferase (sialic acid O-acetyltransferase NeuD family)
VTRPLVVVGAAGHGREVLDVVDACNASPTGASFELVGVLDDNPSEENLERLAKRGVNHLGRVDAWARQASTEVAFVVGVGSPGARRRVVEFLEGAGFTAATLVHPTVVSGFDVTFEKGSVVCAGVVLGTNIRVGRHTHLNRSATVGHDSTIGGFVLVNPSASISGDCAIGDEVLVGAGAVILQGRAIGRGATVGASACVVRDVRPGATVKGVPAE